MKATIAVDGIRLRAYHGVLPQERKVGNVFEISLSLDYPPALNAVVSDDVAETLNYARAVEIVKEVMCEPSALLEHVAGRIHDALLAEYPDINSGKIVVAKLAPPVSAHISSARFILEF